jgi:uncharacterized protein YjbI with pentapeptide repeats
MARPDELQLLKQGVAAWNERKVALRDLKADLSGADLSGMDLSGALLNNADLSHANLRQALLFGTELSESDLTSADLSDARLKDANLRAAILPAARLQRTLLESVNFDGANLHAADLTKADLTFGYFRGTDLTRANLTGATLHEAVVSHADLRGACLAAVEAIGADFAWSNLSDLNLRGVYMHRANFMRANLSGADLTGAVLSCAILIEANLQRATLTGCSVYGISAWNVNLSGAEQSNLVITPSDRDEPVVTVDNLEVAQFIYLLLNNDRIRSVINTITSKVVLILGRFTPERKAVLDSIRGELRKRDYLPVLFDFAKPVRRDLTETISTLAHMARFIVADITDARSIPQELERIVPGLPSVPVQPLLLACQHEYGMFEHFRRYPWVLEPVLYDNQRELLVDLATRVIGPAEAKVREQTGG